MKKSRLIALIVLFLIFCYLRLSPIINRTVPYTYDQGRDFLKVQEMVTTHNLTFIGPTTGINGLFHGAWWYYLSTIPFIIFNGNPIGFYYFMFFLSLIANGIFTYFIYKNYGYLLSLVFLLFIIVSPYFTVLSFFASNNIVTPYMVGAFIMAFFYLLKSKRSIYFFLTSLFLGFILEFEVSFGLFIIPSFIIVALIVSKIRKNLLNFKNLLYFFSGFIIPFAPRLLFELKNGFNQTKTIINTLVKSSSTTPIPLKFVINERIIMFNTYLKDLFYQHSQFLAICILLIVFIILITNFKKFIKTTYSISLLLLVGCLFAISLLYKQNFWTNYYEGIQYIFLFFIISVISLINKTIYGKLLNGVLITLLVIFSTLLVIENSQPKNNVLTGLKSSEIAIKYIYDQNTNKNEICLRVYTPPVIPYTYYYLTDYNTRVNHQPKRTDNFVNHQCWFIVEKDVYQFRVDEWRKNNEPKDGKKILSKNFNQDYVIELWQSQP